MLKDKIIEAKKIVDGEARDIIVRDLKIEQWNDTTQKGLCPFHKEKTPSFTWFDGDNAFKCFGCGKRYGLLDHFQSHYKKSTKTSLAKLFQMAGMSYDIEYKAPKKYRYPHAENELTSEKIISYCKARGISKQSLEYAGIKQDDKENIVFEYYDEGDTLMMVKYRPSRKVVKGEAKNWCQKDADTAPILWGMDKINPTKPLIITEGEIDRLALIECGFLNCVSIPLGSSNTHWIEYNFDWLEQFDEIIICGDDDEAGLKMLDEVIPRLGDWRCKTIEYLPCTYKGKKQNPSDLNEILFFGGQEALKETIRTASEVPIKNIKEMSLIENIELSQMQGFDSGIRSLTAMIDKFFLGTLTVMTGQRSSGKSSLVNQMCVCEPVNQGYKTFVYSGELMGYMLKQWIEYPMAGRANIETFETSGDRPNLYSIKAEARKKMEAWYKDKIFVYDNMLDVSARSLIETMENMARKHGVKNFIIDNLMTVDIDDYKKNDSNKNEKAFVLDLVKFAMQFNVCVFLIAHPRKLNEGGTRLRNDDVAGSGNITNLAHYTISMHRITDKEKEDERYSDWDATVDVLKNRFLGRQNQEFCMKFDRASKRFYEDRTALDKKYGWDK